MRIILISVAVACLLLAAPVQAENTLPNAGRQEVLIKNALLTLNDANATGIYTVLHAKLAKPFREQFGPDRLKQVFKPFVDKKIDIDVIAAFPPVATLEPQIDKRGVLLLRGYFATSPSRVHYDLEFIPSEGEWKPIKLNVNVKPANEG